MSTPQTYRRIRGAGKSGPLGSAKLYLGDDHLLLVISNGYSETYKRFYLRDIQAIAFRKSSHGRVWNGIWGGLAGISASIALSTGGVAFLIWCGIAVSFAILLGWNLALGPTCRCEIRTAVQSQLVTSLNRIWRVRRVISELRPMVESLQGRLSPEELAERIELSRRGSVATGDSGTVPLSAAF